MSEWISYCQQLRLYAQKFSFSAKYQFTSIRIIDEEIEIDKFLKVPGFILKDNYIYLHKINNKDKINKLLIEFVALLSFIPHSYQENASIFNLLFLYGFKPYNSQLKVIKKWYSIIFEVVKREFNNFFIGTTIIDKFISTVPLKIIVTEFLPSLESNCTSKDIVLGLAVYYRRYITNSLSINDIRQIIKRNKIQDEGIVQYQKASWRTKSDQDHVYFSNNYFKINLTTFYITINLSSHLLNVNQFIKNYFFKIPFLSKFRLNNRNFSFFCLLPNTSGAPDIVYKFLDSLKKSKFIINFTIDLFKSYQSNISYELKIQGKNSIFSSFPFNSVKYLSKNQKFKNRKTAFQENISLNSEEINYNHQEKELNTEIDSLKLFLIFHSQNIFYNFHSFQTSKEFFQYIKNIISQSKIKKIVNLYPNISHFESSFRKFQELEIFQKFINIHQFVKFCKTNPNFTQKDKNFAILLKYIGINNPKILQTASFNSYILITWLNLIENFGKIRNYSSLILEKKLNSLLGSTSFNQMNNVSVNFLLQSKSENLIMYLISGKIIKWIKEILFLYNKSSLIPINSLLTNKEKYQIEFIMDLNHYQLFVKYLILENIEFFAIFHIIHTENIKIDLITFYNYQNQQWNEDFFCLDHLIVKSMNEKEKYLKLNSDDKVFQLTHEYKYHFSYKKFFNDLKSFNILNNASKMFSQERNLIINLFQKIFQSQTYTKQEIEELLKDPTDSRTSKRSYIIPFINFEAELNPSIDEMKKIYIICTQPNSTLNPFLFLKDPLLQGLFTLHLLQDVHFFGGKSNGILILDYLIPISIYMSEKSEWNRLLNNISQKYPSLQLTIYIQKSERKFFNEHALMPLDWRYEDYLILKKPKRIKMEMINPNELNNSFIDRIYPEHTKILIERYRTGEILSSQEKQSLFDQNVLYYPKIFSWEFWQIIQYPVTVVVLITQYNEDDELNIISFMEQLPTGKISHMENEKTGNKELLVFLQLRDNIPRFFERFISILEKFKLEYFISPLISIDLFHDNLIFQKFFQISRSKSYFKTAKGDLLELPLFLWHQRYQTYSLEEQITIYEAINEIYPKIKNQLTHQNWKLVLKIISKQHNDGEFTNQAILENLIKKFQDNKRNP